LLQDHGWTGERITDVKRDERTGRGHVIIDLTTVYPTNVKVAEYTRTFLFEAARRITVRDKVVLDEPPTLSWLFQTRRGDRATLAGITSQIGSDPTLTLAPTLIGAELSASIHETPVVWTYGRYSGFEPFDHVRYDSTEPVASVIAEFVLTW
jgi:hypothetical protein